MGLLGRQQSLRTYRVMASCGLLLALISLAYVLSSGSNVTGPTLIQSNMSTMEFWRTHGRLHGLPTEKQLSNMTDKEVNNIYHSYLDNTEVLCHRKLRLGSAGDGGWEVCDDYEYRPIPPCVVYSFGINNDFSFDDEMAVLYGCKVYSFDPSEEQLTCVRRERE